MTSSASAADHPAEPERPGLVRRIIDWGLAVWRRVSGWPPAAHIIRALDRYYARLGSQFAAAITYFSLLSLIPILMVSFSIAGFILADRPDLLAELKDEVTGFLPTDLANQIGMLIDQAISARFTVGLIGLAIALYSGVGWMRNVRRALQAIWRPVWEQPKGSQDNYALATVKDLGSLAGLGFAVLVSVVLSTVGNAAQNLVIRWLGLEDVPWVKPVLTVVTLLIAALASLLIFLWIYARLPPPEYRAPWRQVLIGGAIAAAGFELLKSGLTYLVRGVSNSATAAVFGSIIGLLFFFNIVAQMFLIIGAWIATDVHTPGGLVGVDLEDVEEAGIETDTARSLAAAESDATEIALAESADGSVLPSESTDGSEAWGATPVSGSARPAAGPDRAPVAAALGVGLVTGWVIGRRGARRGRD
jgi:membrane protein